MGYYIRILGKNSEVPSFKVPSASSGACST